MANFTAGPVIRTIPTIEINNKDVESLKLPYQTEGYETLQYLETPSASTTAMNNAFIDTGYAPSGDGYKYEIKFYRNAPTTSSFVGVFGAQNSSAIMCLYDKNGYFNGFSSKAGSARITNINVKDETEYTVIAEGKNDTVTYNVNGEVKSGTTYTTMTDLTGKNIYLFKNNNTSVQPMSGKIYYFKLWKDDVLVRDMIPVRRLSDGELGFYDRVENKFYNNAGNGTIEFVAGPKTTIYETAWTKAKEIPSIYTKKNYLESTGTQYIDTGYKVDDTCGLLLDYMALTTTDDVKMGTKGSGDSRWVVSGNNNLNVNISWNSSSAWQGTGTNTRQVVTMNYFNDRKRILNGTEVTEITTPLSERAADYNVLLFGAYWGSTTIQYKTISRIYRAQITKGNTLVRDLVPVVRNSDSKPGMYDKCTDQFFTNSGTGDDFIVG